MTLRKRSVSRRSPIWRWRAKHEEFCNAVKAGKEAFDDRVERSLAQRAIGYSFQVEKVFHFQGVPQAVNHHAR